MPNNSRKLLGNTPRRGGVGYIFVEIMRNFDGLNGLFAAHQMNEQHRNPIRRRLFGSDGPCLMLTLLLAGLALVGYWQTPKRINHNCAILLQQAGVFLDGGMPYCDFVDNNPPLITYLNVIPVALARVLGVSAITTFHGMVVGLMLVSMLEILFLLRQPLSGLRPPQRWLVLLAWAALSLVVDWQGDFGQREHLFVLLYVPYLFLRILRFRGGSVAAWLAIVLGIQVAVGSSLKPHFLLAVAGVEAALLVGSRRWRLIARPEIVAAAIVVTAYAAHWLFVPTAMREAFFYRWVPFFCRGYGAYNAGFRQILDGFRDSPLSMAALTGVLIAALLCTQRRGRFHVHLSATVAFAIMGLLLLLVQHKGWSYHYIPFYAAGFLALATAIVAGGRRWVSDKGLWAGGSLLLGAGTDVVYGAGEHPGGVALGCSAAANCRAPHAAGRSRADGGHFRAAYLSDVASDRPSAGQPLPLLHADRHLVRGRKTDRGPADLSQSGRGSGRRTTLSGRVARNVERLRPRLIVVNDSRGWQGLPPNFNTFEYLVHCGWCQSTLAAYHETDGLKEWKVFERNTP